MTSPLAANFSKPPRRPYGFSLVEVLAAVAIIGIITFLALPNILRVQQDSEVNLAIAKAEGVNVGMVSFIQANGFLNARTTWDGFDGAAGADESRYDLVAPYLGYAPANLVDYMPAGYKLLMPVDLTRPMPKVELRGPTGTGTPVGGDPGYDSIAY
jgi:prepilin-type N-terminal cleavage/methylation domain-containing protein